MTTQSAPVLDLMPPPPLAARRPIKRTSSKNYGATQFDERTRARPAPPKAAPTSAPKAPSAPDEPGFWDRVDDLARSAAGRTRALGKDALASVKSWRKGAAPAPRAKPMAPRDPAVEAELLGALLVSAQIEEVRRAADGFVRALVALATSIAQASDARAANANRTSLVAHFGDELVGDVTHEPSTRRVLEMHAKRALMTPASLDDAMKLVGTDWERDADAAAGKLAVRSADGAWELIVDVAFATFRLRERTGRFVDVTGTPVTTRDAKDAFVRTHFRIA